MSFVLFYGNDSSDLVYLGYAGSMNEEIKTDNAPAARGLLSQAVISGNLIFTAGQIHLTTDGKLVGDVDFDAALGVAGLITPSRRGIGPMTITMLLRNTLNAYKARKITRKPL